MLVVVEFWRVQNVEGCRVERRAKLSVSVVCSPEHFNPNLHTIGNLSHLPFGGLTLPLVFVAFVGPGRRCRRPLPVAASVEKSEDNAIYTLHLICHNKKKIAGLAPDGVLLHRL